LTNIRGNFKRARGTLELPQVSDVVSVEACRLAKDLLTIDGFGEYFRSREACRRRAGGRISIVQRRRQGHKCSGAIRLDQISGQKGGLIERASRGGLVWIPAGSQVRHKLLVKTQFETTPRLRNCYTGKS